MLRYDEAEKMHLKAIEIKEAILGKEDYEVALSVGHLASLYNYDMKQYFKAERLYLRSIMIGRKLFGPTYSGLEYDYRGLIKVMTFSDMYSQDYTVFFQVYQITNDLNKYMEYVNVLEEWRISRDTRQAEQVSQNQILWYLVVEHLFNSEQ